MVIFPKNRGSNNQLKQIQVYTLCKTNIQVGVWKMIFPLGRLIFQGLCYFQGVYTRISDHDTFFLKGLDLYEIHVFFEKSSLR